jgi:hypothetical protein
MKTFKNGASQSWSWRCGRWLAADDHMSKAMMKKDAMIKGTMGKATSAFTVKSPKMVAATCS